MSCRLRDGVRTFYPRAIRSIEVTDLCKGGFQKGSELSLSILEFQARSGWFLPLSLSDSGG